MTLLQVTNITFDEARIYLDGLDLQYLIDFMCSARYPLPRWHHEDAKQCALKYKNFLWLQKKHGKHFYLVPSKEVDEFWHNHILYTKQYVNDCKNIFGYYLHHDPASPQESDDTLVQNYIKTKQLYFDEFNEPLK